MFRAHSVFSFPDPGLFFESKEEFFYGSDRTVLRIALSDGKRGEN